MNEYLLDISQLHSMFNLDLRLKTCPALGKQKLENKKRERMIDK